MFKVNLDKNITVERKAMVFAVDTTEYIPYAIIENTSRPYSTGLVGKSVNVGLTFDLQLDCPAFISQVGVSATSPEFTERVDDFWSEWGIQVPISKFEKGEAPAALIIDGGYSVRNGKLIPNDINEFLAFNIMISDPKVGKSEEDYIEARDEFDFYIIDLATKEAKAAEKAEATMNITLKLAELFGKSDVEAFARQVLISSKEYKYQELLEMNTKSKVLDAVIKFSSTKPELFIATMNTPDLDIRSMVHEMIQLEVLTTVGNQYFNGSDPIGGVKECVLYMKDPTKDIDVKRLKATLEEVKMRDVVS